MTTVNQTPVVLLTGYLGSGKTTLVNHILTNSRGIRFAVIVNDIGEINVDASLISKGGIVGGSDDSLVALQNGCICCTLQMDLVRQIEELVRLDRFDYIVIEASGICEPAPIARTICSIPYMSAEYTAPSVPRLDCIVTVVDALRLLSEFDCGRALTPDAVDEEDIENLIIQQIEFCNIILLNKASEVSPQELARIRAVIHELQPDAEVIECDYANVDMGRILDTRLFDFEATSTSARWVKELENHHHEADDDDDGHDHHHQHHHHHHGEGEAEEYGIQTFVYFRREPFDLNRFDYFLDKEWDKNIIRTKGVLYFEQRPDMSYLFEQAGVQKKITEAGLWYATAPEDDLRMIMEQNPDMMDDWDPHYGDRMIKLVFIGKNLDRDAITAKLDRCLGHF